MCVEGSSVEQRKGIGQAKTRSESEAENRD